MKPYNELTPAELAATAGDGSLYEITDGVLREKSREKDAFAFGPRFRRDTSETSEKQVICSFCKFSYPESKGVLKPLALRLKHWPNDVRDENDPRNRWCISCAELHETLKLSGVSLP